MDESDRPPQPVTGMMSAAAAIRPGAASREAVWRDFLARAASGEHDAFAAFYDATSSLVFSLVARILGNRSDAEEVTLDVYVQAWRDAARFDSERGSVTAWLLTIARSRALDRYRSLGTRQKREDASEPPDVASAEASPEQLAAASQDRRQILAALATLSPEQREAIELAYFKGLSQSELAEHLELPLGTVKTRVRLGMMKLREFLERGKQ